jgi:hypothetical protein
MFWNATASKRPLLDENSIRLRMKAIFRYSGVVRRNNYGVVRRRAVAPWLRSGPGIFWYLENACPLNVGSIRRNEGTRRGVGSDKRGGALLDYLVGSDATGFTQLSSTSAPNGERN